MFGKFFFAAIFFYGAFIFSFDLYAVENNKIKQRLEEKINQRKEDFRANQDNKSNYIKYDSNGDLRQYILYVPKNVKFKIPLIVVLHGSYGTGAKMEKTLGFNFYANKYGFSVAYLDAYTIDGSRQTLRWNDGRQTLASTKKGIDDVKAVRDMVSDIAKKIDIDYDRIFVAGASNGGIMAYRLGCEASDLIKGIAAVIGNLASPLMNKCKPSSAVSLLAINGDKDDFIPFDGGKVCKEVNAMFCEKGEVLSYFDSMMKFAKNAKCDINPERKTINPKFADGTVVEKISFLNCDKAKINGYIIHEGGHSWPPFKSQIGEKGGVSSKNLNATKEIVEFFNSI